MTGQLFGANHFAQIALNGALEPNFGAKNLCFFMLHQ